MHKRLFIPGPTEVSDDCLRAMSTPMIGHREEAFKQLYRDCNKLVGEVLQTGRLVLFGEFSATGGMELAARNLTRKKSLNLTCGAFSERCQQVFETNGAACTQLAVEWGKANKAESLEQYLETGEYDLVTVVHNETSTGITAPLREIAATVKKYPDVLLAVDAVSSMSGLPIDFDGWDVDFCYAGLQKCWALPPGLTVMVVSEAALGRAAQIERRGFYFDLIGMADMHKKDYTVITPNISLMFALREQCKSILKEGVANRHKRHHDLAERVRGWGLNRFGLFAEEGYESDSLTVFNVTPEWSTKKVNAFLEANNYVIGAGYGKIKDSTFRIAHMGNATMDQINELLGLIDTSLKG